MKETTKIRKIKNKEVNRLKIKEERINLNQEISYLFRPLAICPFPAKQPKKVEIIREIMGIQKKTTEHETIWERQNGKIRVEITANPKYGIPYGQDVLIILYLSREAILQKNRVLRLNFYRDFCRMFDINPNDGRKYLLVQKSLQRIRNSKFSWIDESDPQRERETHYLYIDDVDIFFDPKNPEQKPLWGDQKIVLSERFWNEITTHKIPFNIDSVRYLKGKPACLNFYIWLSYRVWKEWNLLKIGSGNGQTKISLWGKGGLQEQLSSRIIRRPNYRMQVKRWLKDVKEIWPSCPVELDSDILKINITEESQLDIQESYMSEGKRLRQTQEIENIRRCDNCESPMISKKGKLNKKGTYQPDYWHCPECNINTPKIAICPNSECGKILENNFNGFYFCSNCKKSFSIKKYWENRG
jgi:hypothetical protein